MTDTTPRHECPMCGELMQLRERQVVTRIPGTSQTVSSAMREWVCPECDYFEEAEPEAKPL